MKTRIVYPDKIWLNKIFHELDVTSKLFCLYLISNRFIELTNIYKCPDLAIMFDLKLTESELKKLKGKISNTGLFYFYEEWVFVNNDFSYTDYQGRDRVLEAKKKEINSIPADVSAYFKGVLNPLKSGYKPPINTKSETINHKSKTINHKPETINTKYNTLKSVNSESLFEELAVKYGVSPEYVADRYEDLEIYCGSNGKVYKDYYLALINFIKNNRKLNSYQGGQNAKPNIVFVNPE